MVKPGKSMNGFFHSLIPAALRESLGIHTMQYVRVRTLSAFLAIATALTFLFTIVLVVVHAIFFWDQLKFDLIAFGVLLMFGLQTWFFHKFNNYWLSGLLLSNFYFLLMLILVIISGGYDAPTKIFLLLSPVLFFMMGGIRDGIQNAVFVAIIGAALGYLKSINFEFINIFHDGSQHIVFSLTWIIVIIGMTICITAYDIELEKRG